MNDSGNTDLAAAAPSSLYPAISYETSRRGFLRSAGKGLAVASTMGLVVAACKGDPTGTVPPPLRRALAEHDGHDPVVTLPLRSDTDILKFALFLELLEADFYTKAVAAPRLLTGIVKTLATSIRDHENTHVSALQAALGAASFGTADVGFEFGTALATQASFLATAQVLEQTGVGAYLGQLGRIQSRAIRTTAGSIFTIEARHLAAIRVFNNSAGGPVPNAFETPTTAEAVVNAVVATQFVTKGLGGEHGAG